MRFVEWNCCEGFDRDLPALIELGCDLAVLCEVPQALPPRSLLDPEIDWCWTGDLPRKGLAVASFGSSLTADEERSGRGTHTVAATTTEGIGVLGIWTCPPKGATYGAQAHAAIDVYADWLRDTPSIVAGDFNLAPNGTEDAALRKVFDDLERLGYRSAYHHHFTETYGAETRPTFFFRRKLDAPFHIDYRFVHESLVPQIRSVEVGSFERWVARQGDLAGQSDHVPLIVDLDV